MPNENRTEAGATRMTEFQRDLESLLNRYSWDVATGIPDFILADILLDSLASLSRNIDRRDKWHGVLQLTPVPEATQKAMMAKQQPTPTVVVKVSQSFDSMIGGLSKEIREAGASATAYEDSWSRLIALKEVVLRKIEEG